MFFGKIIVNKSVITKKKIRIMNIQSINNIIDELSSIDWKLADNFNVNDNVKFITDNLNSCLDKYAPEKSIKISNDNLIRQKWMTRGLI